MPIGSVCDTIPTFSCETDLPCIYSGFGYTSWLIKTFITFIFKQNIYYCLPRIMGDGATAFMGGGGAWNCCGC
jgi:hypothetical protein